MNQPAVTFEEVAGAILTGGKSRRLGRDKILLQYGDRPLVSHLHDLLKGLFPRVFLVGHPRAELETLGFECVEDVVPGKGALGGLYTAVMTAGTPAVFVMAADMPFVTPSLIDQVVRMRDDADAVIPRGPRGYEPLCALYSHTCAAPMKKAIDKGYFKIMAALEGLKILTPEISMGEGGRDPFANINYPEDWDRLGIN